MAFILALREKPPQRAHNSSNMSITGFGKRIRGMAWAAAITTTKISTTESGRMASDMAQESTSIRKVRDTSASGSQIGEKGPMGA
jgi:hypothetical protein